MKKKELRQRIESLEVRVADLERRVGYQLWVTPIASQTTTDCNCPRDSTYICHNYICPRALRVTS